MNKRRDNKGRILHFGEYQMPDGRYRFKYTDAFGKSVCVYSNRLDLHDPFPPGKKDDPHFNIYYEGIYILFKTGMRISEFCGLTVSDINFENHSINIDHQLMKHVPADTISRRQRPRAEVTRLEIV